MSSGANSFNPFVRKKLMKEQIEKEHKDREAKWGHKERDSLESYLNIRKNMVREYAYEMNKALTKNEIDQLAKSTRGKMKEDIQKCIDGYLKTGEFPEELSHPTNTCDPYTGNWAEHLIDPYLLTKILSERGFKSCVLGGYYGRPKNALKRLLGTVSNIYISAFKKQGLKVAPFYTIYGKRN
jgi:hypothetical protein